MPVIWGKPDLHPEPIRPLEMEQYGPARITPLGNRFAIPGALRDLEIPVASRVLLQLNSDEEVGSQSSRPLTEKNAARSHTVLVLEPGTGLRGKLKTARKGVGNFTLTVRGVASHAGVDFAAGSSAVLELARQIARIAGFTIPAAASPSTPG